MEKNFKAKGIVHIYVYTGLSQLKMSAEEGVINMMDGPTQIKQIW